MRKKERQLMKVEGFRYGAAETPADIDRILTFFRAQKAVRFAAQGIHNVFADPGVMDFIADACRDGLAQGRPVIELHALEGGGDVLAVLPYEDAPRLEATENAGPPCGLPESVPASQIAAENRTRWGM